MQMVRRIFVGYDADQSGTLEFGEFRRCLTESQLGLSDKQISYLMSVSDVRAAHSHLQRSTLHVSSSTLFTPPALDASDLQRLTLFTPPAFEFALRSTCVHLVSTFCSLRVHLVFTLCPFCALEQADSDGVISYSEFSDLFFDALIELARMEVPAVAAPDHLNPDLTLTSL